MNKKVFATAALKEQVFPGGNYSLKTRKQKSNSKIVRNDTYREVHAVELVDEGFHPGFILFVDWFVHLKTEDHMIIN